MRDKKQASKNDVEAVFKTKVEPEGPPRTARSKRSRICSAIPEPARSAQHARAVFKSKGPAVHRCPCDCGAERMSRTDRMRPVHWLNCAAAVVVCVSVVCVVVVVLTAITLGQANKAIFPAKEGALYAG